ncbi:AAA family ATPase [Methylocaldum sp.]|uniref:AAA family ATPase n=1 Tax=Methylocaldum sp. TaxID=1969727 RepID=UPI002D5AF426|nr:AAA family ATPase [Methylocaldum sp.]HYE36008.1 AAA family ATPase [Methylocaldum sp.]
MISSETLIHEFAPLCLTVDRVGPFQDRVEEFDLTDAGNEPCNFYLFVSKNGRGKTTVFELLVALMNMLGREELPSFGFEPLDREGGRAQLDVKVTLGETGYSAKSYVLSLIGGEIGEEYSLKAWGEEDLRRVGAGEWHRLGFRRTAAGRLVALRASDWAKDFNALIANAVGMPLKEFGGDPLTYPTLIYFSAYRNIQRVPDIERSIVAPRDWNYRPVHVFDIEGRDWRDSLDNLLVWLKWLEDRRFEQAVKTVNDNVFAETPKFLKGVRKDPPEGIIVNEGHEHRLDRLSSGEKSLVQIYLRLGAHMTGNTFLLIDEPEVHLHRNWQYGVLFSLMKMAKQAFPKLIVFLATHSERMMKAFAHDIEEEGLRKGGFIIETVGEESRAERIAREAAEIYGGLNNRGNVEATRQTEE